MSKNVDQRGTNNTTANDAYSSTVASYTSGSVSGDNTIEDITCDASVFVGAVVRLNGSTVVNAQADSISNSDEVLGICVSKSSSTLCNVLTCGYTNSIMSGLTAGQTYFLSTSTPGQISTTVATSAGHVVMKIGVALSATEITFQPDIRLVRS